MSPESIVAIVGGMVALAGFSFFVIRKIPKRLKRTQFTRKWRDLQGLCSNKETWSDAIVAADKLLDEALRKRRKNGRSMGERLVEAQKELTNNDAVWKAHKLAGQLMQQTEDPRLKEDDVKDSLVAFRQALRDLGAL